MLQLSFIRQYTNEVKERLSIKNFEPLSLVDDVVALDETRRQLQASFDALQAQIKNISKQIGIAVANKNEDEANNLKAEVALLKEKIEPLKEQLQQAEINLQEACVKLPNLPSPLVPRGKTASDNEIIKEVKKQMALPANPLPHWDLITKFNLIDFETGAKITGSGFPLYKAQGAKLQRALVQYFLDFNIHAGYEEYATPFLVNEASAFGTGQLPDKEGQMYFIPEDNFYLIPTAEVPLTNIYRDVILKETELPLKMTAYTPCFRREAGSFGKDVRGLNRVHQFEKVEIVQIVQPEKSYEVLNEMVAHVEKLLQSLQLPYRIVRLCGGDLSFTSALTYDFEVFSAAQNRWLEVSSVSNFETFQTYRIKCRYKDAQGKIHYPHSLNGSSLALPRIAAAILENNQTEKNIQLPTILHPYFGAAVIE